MWCCDTGLSKTPHTTGFSLLFTFCIIQTRMIWMKGSELEGRAGIKLHVLTSYMILLVMFFLSSVLVLFLIKACADSSLTSLQWTMEDGNVCDVAEQEGSTRSRSRSRAPLSCEMGSRERSGVEAAGMPARTPGPRWSCTHMQWHEADSQSSALLRLTDEQWQHEVTLPLGGFRQKGCFDLVWKCTTKCSPQFLYECECVYLCVRGVDWCVWLSSSTVENCGGRQLMAILVGVLGFTDLRCGLCGSCWALGHTEWRSMHLRLRLKSFSVCCLHWGVLIECLCSVCVGVMNVKTTEIERSWIWTSQAVVLLLHKELFIWYPHLL